MSLTSRVTVSDGTNTVNVDARSTLGVEIQTESAGGGSNLRMADGTITRQVSWEKRRVILTSTGWIDPALSSIDWSKQITLTVPDAGGTRSFTGYCDEPQDNRGDSGGAVECRWVLTLEEG
jgi:hypothetical protein